ncbi:MAG: hypothetical protein JWO38_4416 [Gemmataceae bacterium]|nr:hypothetical protein [Gemmataceae bacterium]
MGSLVGMMGLLWGSVPLIALGTFAQSRSAAYRLAEDEALQEIVWRAEERDHKPGIGLGWGVAYNWLFVGLLCTVIAWAYTLGLQAVRVVCHRTPEIGRPLAVLFGSLCVVGAGFLLRLLLVGRGDQPGLLSLGYLLAASGLSLGVIVVSHYCRTALRPPDLR